MSFVKVKNVRELSWPLPQYESDGAAGMDVRAFVASGSLTLKPMQRFLVPTGLAIEIPYGFEMQIRPRSGLALKHGITMVNAPGTIDSDYRGEVGVVLINLGESDYELQHGERIAQMVLAPVTRCTWIIVEELEETRRGVDGFGSTGN
ncbi:MAG TPA: dUTP diphosphatase [Rhodobacteraceae bacterium]|nr:dUTP diphosphatase [Paracoccaceae bacterium]